MDVVDRFSSQGFYGAVVANFKVTGLAYSVTFPGELSELKRIIRSSTGYLGVWLIVQGTQL